jgi:hypothetical protein
MKKFVKEVIADVMPWLFVRACEAASLSLVIRKFASAFKARDCLAGGVAGCAGEGSGGRM